MTDELDGRRLPRAARILLLVAWSALVWELLTGTRVKPEPWFWFMPYVYNLSHAVLFGVEALLVAWAMASARRSGARGWTRSGARMPSGRPLPVPAPRASPPPARAPGRQAGR